MEEGLKDRIILILLVITVMFFIAAVSSCSRAGHFKASRDKEMSSRLDLEEKMGNFTQEKAALEDKINKLSGELEVTKKALQQELATNQSIKEELDKVTKLKETLEEDLKEALVKKSKVSKTKR